MREWARIPLVFMSNDLWPRLPQLVMMFPGKAHNVQSFELVGIHLFIPQVW